MGKKVELLPYARFFKANLHTHTTLSDGSFTPEEIKERYLSHGYSVVAYTEHDLYIPHYAELSDENFLALNAFEVEINENNPATPKTKTCHICMIAKDKNNHVHPLWHKSKYFIGNASKYKDLVKFDEKEPDYEREYTSECINDMISRGKKAGFFVTYNHPKWSLEGYRQYSEYSGMDAMEIFNNDCYSGGFGDYNPEVYDEFLRIGKRIYCLATDDTHREGDMFGGFTMINARSLTYENVIDSLEKGYFYASRGPLIHGITFDTQTKAIHVDCSSAKSVCFYNGIRRSALPDKTYADKNGITGADFKLNGDENYVRITVEDYSGATADTNAYFIDDLFKL